MSQPDSGEYSVRSLAEILREHGLETELGTRPGRRRRTTDDPEATGRSARVDAGPRAPGAGQKPPAAASPAAARSAAARAAAARSAGAGRPAAQAPAARASAAASPSPVRVPVTTWPDQSAGTSRPLTGLAGPVAPARDPAPAREATPAREAAPARTPQPVRSEPSVRAPRDSPDDRTSTTGRVGERADAAPSPVRVGRRKSDAGAPVVDKSTGLFGTGPSTSAIPVAAATSSRAAVDHPVTGPIPVQRAEPVAEEEDEPLTGKESVLAWLRFGGELIVALAVGIGLYFAFTVLWELMPYVALVAAPVSVTALVAGVAAYRQRRGQGQLGVRLLAVLLLAGTVLVIAPAAGLLAA
jgi:hypothetical protein